MSIGNNPVRLVEVITAPLGFFVLALLIAESFLATVLIGAKLPEGTALTGMLLGVGMFVLVVIAVAVLVWNKPKNLTFDKEAHLVEGGKVSYGSNQNEVDPQRLVNAPASTEESGGER